MIVYWVIGILAVLLFLYVWNTRSSVDELKQQIESMKKQITMPIGDYEEYKKCSPLMFNPHLPYIATSHYTDGRPTISVKEAIEKIARHMKIEFAVEEAAQQHVYVKKVGK